RRGVGLAVATLQFLVQPEHRLEGLVRDALRDLQRRDPQLQERVRLLNALERDLERRAAVRRLRRDEVTDGDVGRLRDRLQECQLRLALAVLDEAELASRHADDRAQLVESEILRDAMMPDPVPERLEFDTGVR